MRYLTEDLLLPRTDAGVFAQLIVLGVVTAMALRVLRDRPNVRLLAIWVSVFLLSLMGLRALH